MAEDKWKLSKVATQTEEVVMNGEKVYTLAEVLVILLNQNEKIIASLG